MNKGIFAIIAAAALTATKNITSERHSGSFARKRNKSIEKFDQDLNKILTSLGSKKKGISLLDAFKKAQIDSDYAGSCLDCPQAYAYASFMLSVLIHIEGFGIPDERLSGGHRSDFTGDLILEVFSFEGTPKGKKFSDSMIWEIEKWFNKCKSDFDRLGVSDSSALSIVNEGILFFNALQDKQFSPNYVGTGILGMGITGYAFVQFLRLFIAIPGDKDLDEIAMAYFYKNVDSLGSSNFSIDLFSYSPEEDGDLPNLFGEDYSLSLLIRVMAKIKKDKGEESRDYLRANRRVDRFIARRETKIVDPKVVRDRFISDFFKVNRVRNSIIIQDTASYILSSITLLSNNRKVDTSRFMEFFKSFEMHLHDLQQEINEQWSLVLYKAKDMFSDDFKNPNLRVLKPREYFISLSDKKSPNIRNQYLKSISGIRSNESASVSIEHNRFGEWEATSLTGETLREHYFENNREVFWKRVDSKFAKLIGMSDEELNYNSDELVSQQHKNTQLYKNLFSNNSNKDITYQDFCDEYFDKNNELLDKDLNPFDADAIDFSRPLSEVFSNNYKGIDTLEDYLFGLYLFSGNIRENRGSGLEEGMINYLSSYLRVETEYVRSILGQAFITAGVSLGQASGMIDARKMFPYTVRSLTIVRPSEDIKIIEELDKKEILDSYNDSLRKMSSKSSDMVIHSDVSRQDQDRLGKTYDAVAKRLKPIRVLLIEYKEPSLLKDIRNITPGNLCVGEDDNSYMDGVRYGTQRHFGIVVETAMGLHVLYHTHYTRGRWTSDRFTNKHNSNSITSEYNTEHKRILLGAEEALRSANNSN